MRLFYSFVAVTLLTGCERAARVTETPEQLLYGLLLFGFLVLALSGTSWRNTPLATGIKNAAIWVGLFAALVVGYSYRAELNTAYLRVKSEILPGSPVQQSNGLVRLARSGDGHFSTFGSVNGQMTEFLVDTGASMVVLPYREAVVLGFSEDELEFSQPVSTANGDAFAAPIMIKELQIGPISVKNVRASVSEPGDLSTPLLGMSFLDRLSSYSFEGDALTLRQ